MSGIYKNDQARKPLNVNQGGRSNQMKGIEDLHKGIQLLVDLTKQDDLANSPQLQLIKMPDLSLVMSKYFLAMSKFCLTHYHSHAKTNKKPEKQKGDSGKGKEQFDHLNAPPKKPLTAYILYFQDRVPSFQQKYPKYTISELTRLIAKEWKELPQDQKKPYIDKAAADRKRYENDKRQFKLKRGLKKIDQEESNRNPADENSDSQNRQKIQIDDAQEMIEEVDEGI